MRYAEAMPQSENASASLRKFEPPSSIESSGRPQRFPPIEERRPGNQIKPYQPALWLMAQPLFVLAVYVPPTLAQAVISATVFPLPPAS